MKHLQNIEEFDEIIKEGKTVVDFYATWCGPCNMLSPIMEEVANNHKEMKFLKVDTDEFIDLARRYGIMSIPTIKVFENGIETASTTGFMDRNELEDFIK